MLMKKEIIEDNKKLKEELEKLKRLYETDRVSASEIIVEQDKKIKRLNKKLENLEKLNNANYQSFIEVNNIINEFDKWLLGEQMMFYKSSDDERLIRYEETKFKWLELKGVDKE